MTWTLDQPESRPMTGRQGRLAFPEPSAIGKVAEAFTARQEPPTDDLWDDAVACPVHGGSADPSECDWCKAWRKVFGVQYA